VRNYLVAQLGALGYRTFHGARLPPRRSRSSTARWRFDLLFTDVIMPGTMNAASSPTRRSSAGRHSGAVHIGLHRNAIVHHGRLDPGVLLLAKPYGKRIWRAWSARPFEAARQRHSACALARHARP